MEKNYLITICIPTYNRAKKLENLLALLSNYNLENIKINISDNASTDDTKKLCLRYQLLNNNIFYYRQEKNLGAFNNFNFLLSIVDTPYFILHGDDDWLDKNFIIDCFKFLEENKDYSIATGVSYYDYFSENKRIIRSGRFFSVESNYRIFRYIKYYFFNGDNYHLCGLTRSKYLKSYFPLILPGDWIYMKQFLSSGKIKTFKNIKVYRSYGDNSSISVPNSLISINKYPQNIIGRFFVNYLPWLYISYNFSKKMNNKYNPFIFIFWFSFMLIKKFYEILGKYFFKLIKFKF